MDKDMYTNDQEKLKKLLGGLRQVDVSKDKQDSFLMKLEELPARKVFSPVPDLVRETYHRLSQTARDFGNALWVPLPAYAKAAVIMVAFSTMFYFGLSPQMPQVYNIKGTVKIFIAAKNEWVFAQNRQKLREGDILKTFDDGKADIDLHKAYAMRLKRDSEIEAITLSRNIGSKDVRFKVNKGKVLAYYAGSKKKDRTFELSTDQMIATAVGTDFAVESLPQLDITKVGVLDGVVRVTSLGLSGQILPDSRSVLVNPYYMTEVIKGKIPATPTRIIEDVWLEMAELYSIGKKPQVALLLSTDSSRTRKLLSMVPLYISDESSGMLSNKVRKIVEDYNEAVRLNSRELHMKNIRELESIVEKYPNPDYDVTFLLFIGAYYKLEKEYEKSTEAFQRVIDKYGRSTLASIAQCAIGIIYEEQLHDMAKAKDAYTKVITNYPGSPEVEEALSGLKRLSANQ